MVIHCPICAKEAGVSIPRECPHCFGCGRKQLGGLHQGRLCNVCFLPTKRLISDAAIAAEVFSEDELDNRN